MYIHAPRGAASARDGLAGLQTRCKREVDELERSAMTRVWTRHGAHTLSELPLHTPGIRVLRREEKTSKQDRIMLAERFDVVMNL